jgi:hypothetical protein
MINWIQSLRSLPYDASAPLKFRACLCASGGTTDELNPSIINDFKRIGMLHILAIEWAAHRWSKL